MKKTTILALAAATAGLSLTAGAASAQAYGPDRDWRDNGQRGWTDNRGGWMSINQRQAMLDRRIDQGLRSGQLTRGEALRLRAEFRDIARMEARYRANGLNMRERADLDRRFDRLAAQIRMERRDGDNRYGYGYGYR